MLLVDRLVASDPPLERLRLALRTTITMLAAGAVLIPLMKAGIVPGPSAALGAMTGMWASLLVNDTELPTRRITSALAPFSAAAAVTLAAFFDVRSQVLGAVIFVAVTFVGVWVRRCGPRGFALGQMAIFVMLFSLFLRIEPAQLPATFLALAIGAAAALVIRYAVIRDDPHVVLRGAIVAFAARMRLLRAAAEDVERGEFPAAETRLGEETIALNAAALAIDRLVAAPIFVVDPVERHAARVALLDAELAADRLAHAVLAHRGDTGQDGRAPILSARNALGEAIDRARSALHAIARARIEKDADTPISALPSPPRIDATEPTTRLAVQSAAAAALAMLLGTAVPPHLYFWAVLTAFLVYNGTASAAEARGRAWGRSAGTTIGVVLGFALVALVHGRPALEATLSIVFFFLSMYTFRVSYTAFTFFITALVAMVYELVGRPPDPLLLARLTETLVGSACGTIAATFILPLRTHAVVAVTAKAFAEKLAAAVCAAVARLTGGDAGDPVDAARADDAALQDLLARMQPLIGRRRGTAREDALATRAALVESGRRARVLCGRALHAPAAADGSTDALRRAAQAIGDALRAFETILEGRPEIVPDDVAPANAAEIDAAHRRVSPDVAAAAHDLRLIAENVALLSGRERFVLRT